MASNKNVKPGRAGFPPHGEDCSPEASKPTGPDRGDERVEPDPIEVEVERGRTDPAEPLDEDDDPARPILAVDQPVLGLAPSFAMGTFLQMSVGAAGISIQNAVHAQNLQYSLSNAAAIEALDILRGRHRTVAPTESRLLATLDRLVRVIDTLESSAAAGKKST